MIVVNVVLSIMMPLTTIPSLSGEGAFDLVERVGGRDLRGLIGGSVFGVCVGWISSEHGPMKEL